MKIRVAQYDFNVKIVEALPLYLSDWCLQQAVDNALTNKNTNHIIVCNSDMQQTYCVQMLQKLIANKAMWCASSKTFIFDNNSGIKVINRSLKNNKVPLEKYSAYIFECNASNDAIFHYGFKNCIDLFFELKCPIDNLDEIVIECSFQEFIKNYRFFEIKKLNEFICQEIVNIVCNNNEAIQLQVDFCMQGKCPPSCCRHCFLIANTLVVGDKCQYYADFYLKAMKQGNFSLIFSKKK